MYGMTLSAECAISTKRGLSLSKDHIAQFEQPSIINHSNISDRPNESNDARLGMYW